MPRAASNSSLGRFRPGFRLQDAGIGVAYLAILLWFSRIVIDVRFPAFANLDRLEQATQLVLVMFGIGSISTLPLAWIYYSLKSKLRNAVVMPIATTMLISYGTLAVGNPVATMGIATAVAAIVTLVANHWKIGDWKRSPWKVLQGFRCILFLQIVGYLIAGIAGGQ